MKKINSLLIILVCNIAIVSFGQQKHSHSNGRSIDFPDVPGYKTLTTDLHIHSVFSDGKVWPNIRVLEALKDGIDVISLTEHLEYQPHREDIPHPDRNRAFEIARAEAKDHDLIVVNGSEITKDMPPGHVNAIFIKNANALLNEDAMVQFQEAKRQGAFIFWNHPNWIAQRTDGIARLTDMHKKLIKDEMLHGIEVVNEHTFSEEALQIALDNKLTIMGTSDIHGLIDWDFDVPSGGHRPVTLVFAKEKTEASLKQALFEGRTAVWFNNSIIGKDEHLIPLLRASLTVEKVTGVQSYKGASEVQEVTIKNHSDVDFILQNLSEYSFHTTSDLVTIPAHASFKIQVKTLKSLKNFQLKFKVLNAITAPKTNPEITLECISQ